MTQENNNGTSIQEYFNVWLQLNYMYSLRLFSKFLLFVCCLQDLHAWKPTRAKNILFSFRWNIGSFFILDLYTGCKFILAASWHNNLHKQWYTRLHCKQFIKIRASRRALAYICIRMPYSARISYCIAELIDSIKFVHGNRNVFITKGSVRFLFFRSTASVT